MTDKGHDLRDDAPRYVAKALNTVAPDWVAMADLVEHYDPPKPNNMTELQSDAKRAEGKRPTVVRMKERLIGEAVDDINLATDQPVIVHDEDEDAYRLAEGVDANTLKLDGKPLICEPALPDLFDPETGVWRENIRIPSDAKAEKELRESMLAFGYLPDHPIVKDENGIIISGHRRAKMAEELGITPKVVVRKYKDDAERVAEGVGSNLGAEGFSPADRKRIATELYGKPGWDVGKIADKLRVTKMTVYRYLKDLTPVKSPEKPKRGRPRKEPAPEPESIADVIEIPQHPRPAAEVEPHLVIAEDDEDGEVVIEEDNEPVLSTWELSYRYDGSAEVSVTYVDHQLRIPLGGKNLSPSITPAMAAELALKLPAALDSIGELLGRLDERAGEDGS
jgi:transposase